ncbi:MAG: Rrf2 family transcriptional regulator [Acidobacteriota bacterium]|nr:Rrf2 family transcriptional regulator [Acidobacteriota bacterium]
MDMTLSRRGDYVMRAALSLARAFTEEPPRKIREVVADTEIPQSFASQILGDLVRSDLATSRAGRDGGYRLTRPPEQISVLEVVEAAEGHLRAQRCALGDGPCRWDQVCPLHETWTKATARVREVLATTTLAELAEQDAAIEAGVLPLPADSHRSHPLVVDVADSVQAEVSALQVAALAGSLSADLVGLAGRAMEEACAQDADIGGPAVVEELTMVPAGGKPSGYFTLCWSAGGARRNRFEGALRVISVDSQRAELRVEGTWHQLPGQLSPLAATELEARARQALRVFLRGLARAIERVAAAGADRGGRDGAPAPRRSAEPATGRPRRRPNPVTTRSD